VRRPTLAAVLVAVATGLAACGSSDEDRPRPAQEPPAPASTAATSPPGTGTAETSSDAAPERGIDVETVAEGFERPVLVTAPPGDQRLFVVEQVGRVWALTDGRRADRPFLDLTDEVRARGEQGLLGLAFEPGFARTGRFIVNYTNREGDTRIVRFTAPGPRRDRADADSAEQLLAIDQPYANHNGGHVLFGPDGLLYIGMGDGGAAGDPEGRAQNPDELLGKMLRMDVSRRSAGRPYEIPPDNPFARGGGAPEVWAVGLRNPWRYAFDARGGDLWIGDVGQRDAEEINRVEGAGRAGANYGWDLFEGSRRFEEEGGTPAGLVRPVAEFGHDAGGCSVTGGVVVRDPALPQLAGRYLYSDYCAGFVLALDAASPGQPEDLTKRVGGPFERVSSFGEDASGRVYIVEHGGRVLRLVSR
jgi:glucose/arabinose dehydrogenase